MIGSVKVTLASFYVPNSNQDLFLCRQLEKLLEFAEGQQILGGDFNIPLIPTEDTRHSLGSTQGGDPGGTCQARD